QHAAGPGQPVLMRAAAWVAACGALLATGCKKSPRAAARERTLTAPALPAVHDAGLPPDAASASTIDPTRLTIEQADLARAVHDSVRQTVPGVIRLPMALRDRFMREGHVEHAAALGSLEEATTADGRQALRLHLGPSPLLQDLGLQDGDLIVKINGRFVEHDMHPLEEIYLRLLLQLENGALDV